MEEKPTTDTQMTKKRYSVKDNPLDWYDPTSFYDDSVLLSDDEVCDRLNQQQEQIVMLEEHLQKCQWAITKQKQLIEKQREELSKREKRTG